ncbi:hypothetical protein [Streptomyces paradoxus]|uniref:hypothetical protein n=1 Tax=Streptomyces paradoxus TaxID=66375 RepID=UPI0037D092F4
MAGLGFGLPGARPPELADGLTARMGTSGGGQDDDIALVVVRLSGGFKGSRFRIKK